MGPESRVQDQSHGRFGEHTILSEWELCLPLSVERASVHTFKTGLGPWPTCAYGFRMPMANVDQLERELLEGGWATATDKSLPPASFTMESGLLHCQPGHEWEGERPEVFPPLTFFVLVQWCSSCGSQTSSISITCEQCQCSGSSPDVRKQKLWGHNPAFSRFHQPSCVTVILITMMSDNRELPRCM